MTYEMKGTLLHSDVGNAEVYDPVIAEYFNNQVTFYSQTPIVEAPSIYYRFVARVTRNDMVGPKSSLDDLIGGSSGKITLVSHLRQYAAAVSIEDADVLEAQKNGIGQLANIWSAELNYAMVDLNKDLNQAFLSSSTTLGSDFGDPVDSLGAILQATGTIYGKSRSTYPSLAANVASSVGDLSLTDLRNYITTLKTNGGRNFVIYTTPTIATFIKNKMEANKMYIGTSSEAGFVGSLVFDGISIVEDSDVPTGYMYILDRDQYEIAQFVKFSLGASDLSKTNLTTGKYIWGILNLIFKKMNTSYKLSGITS